MFEGVGLQVPQVLLGSLAFSLFIVFFGTGLSFVWFGTILANVADRLAIVTSTGFGGFVRSAHSIKMRLFRLGATSFGGVLVLILFFSAQGPSYVDLICLRSIPHVREDIRVAELHLLSQ